MVACKNVLLLSFFSFFYSLAMEPPSTKKYTPNNTIIAWDFHGVIADYDYMLIGKRVWQNFGSLLPVLNPYILYLLTKMLYTRGTGGEWGDIKKFSPTLVAAMMRVGNSLVPNEQVYDVMKKIHIHGYRQDLISDINTEFLKSLQHERSMKKVFDLLIKMKSVDYTKPHVVFKNDTQYFKDYQQEFNTEGKYVIFIDDWIMNTSTAQRAGLIAILFKGIEQLKRSLQTMQILSD